MKVSLLMVTSDGTAREFPVGSFPITIGRGDECKLRIPLAAVSRKHCELDEDDDELIVRDLGSANGTHVNKDRVKQRELIPGDLLAVGPVVFVVRIDGHPKETDPVEAYAAGAVTTEGLPAALGGKPAGSGAPTVSASRPKSGSALSGGGTRPGADRGQAEPAMNPPAGSAVPAGKPKPLSIDDELDAILKELGDDDDDAPKAPKRR